MKTQLQHGFTQFELSKLVLKNLNKWKLSPTAKLVLMSLTSYYPNIFPSQQTIANELGISKRSVERAFNELRIVKTILTEIKKQTNTLNCKFTNIFFEQLNLSGVCRQYDGLDTDKLANKEISNKKDNKVFSFSSFNGTRKTPDCLKDIELAKCYLSSFPYNTRPSNYNLNLIRQVKEKWNFSDWEFEVFKHLTN